MSVARSPEPETLWSEWSRRYARAESRPHGDEALHLGPRLALGRFRSPTALGVAPRLHRIGAYSLIFHLTASRKLWGDGRSCVVGQNWVSFHDAGDEYRSEAVASEGLRCDWLALEPNTALALLDEFAPHLHVRCGSRVFPFASAPVDAGTFLAYRLLSRYAAQATAPDELLIDELALMVVGRALQALARAIWRSTRRISRPRCERRRRDIVEAAKALLERDYWRNYSLADIAAHSHSSPFHLAREFRRQTGSSLREYQLQLRLRRSLDCLEWPGHEVCAVAAELGFSSHSHFTDAFRRHFAMPPTRYARARDGDLITLARAAR